MRRRNKSAKVPGVKLRPAQPQPSTSKSIQELKGEEKTWADETQLDSEDAAYADACPQPFKGMVISSTGILEKADIFTMAFKLGAQTTSPFTDRVTHLIAETHGGAKYKCAVTHNIPIMLPSWITESYQTWLRGDDVNVPESLEKYRLPIFSGVVMSLSGSLDAETKSEMRKILREEKGSYAEQIQRPVKVTHLVCTGDDETEKVKYAEKFNLRKEAAIHIVWEEWFWDSFRFGGRFEESEYSIRKPRQERKTPQAELPPSSPLTTPTPTLAPADVQGPPATATALPEDWNDDEVASVKRPPAVAVKAWQSLLQNRGYEVSAQGKLVRSPTKKQDHIQDSPDRPLSPVGGSIIAKFRRANSFAQVPVKDSNVQPFSAVSRHVSASSPFAKPGIFVGSKFCALGEANSGTVKKAVEQAGGMMVADEESADFILVRLLSGSKLYRSETDQVLRRKFRTECWLEQSIYEERICEPKAHISFVPLDIEVPLLGAEKVQFSLSGFDEATGCFTRRLARALGMTLAPVFSRTVTHLLCPSATGAKFEKATEWNIPVVDMSWLEEAVRTGILPDVASHRVRRGDELMLDDTNQFQEALAECPQSIMLHQPVPGPSFSGAFKLSGLLQNDCEVSVQVPLKVDLKGKGKAVAINGSAMIDITNDVEGQTTFVRALEGCAQSSMKGAADERRAAIEDDEVPSSRTPSPMKMPSPVKMPPLLDMARPVLLGKRRSEEGPEDRGDKRPRPRATRLKPNSRSPSKTDYELHAPPVNGRLDGFEDTDACGFWMDDDSGGDRGDVDALRVIYDDTEEKRKLMNLLEPQQMPSKGTRTRPVRKSTRRS